VDALLGGSAVIALGNSGHRAAHWAGIGSRMRLKFLSARALPNSQSLRRAWQTGLAQYNLFAGGTPNPNGEWSHRKNGDVPTDAARQVGLWQFLSAAATIRQPLRVRLFMSTKNSLNSSFVRRVAIGDIDILRDEAQAHEVQPCRALLFPSHRRQTSFKQSQRH
jgi:hypothetical protein